MFLAPRITTTKTRAKLRPLQGNNTDAIRPIILIYYYYNVSLIYLISSMEHVCDLYSLLVIITVSVLTFNITYDAGTVCWHCPKPLTKFD